MYTEEENKIYLKEKKNIGSRDIWKFSKISSDSENECTPYLILSALDLAALDNSVGKKKYFLAKSQNFKSSTS